MMYLSHLMIDVGSNPDRPRPGRLWLRNIYHVHQRLSMAFPSRGSEQDDPQFLRPFDPANFERPKFLFRIDHDNQENSPRQFVVVLSDLLPNWAYAFQNADMFLAALPELREYQPNQPAGEVLRFRIKVNLSVKSKEHRKAKEGAEGTKKDQGKRVALTWDENQQPADVVIPWFGNKAARNGFAVQKCELIQLGWVGGFKQGRDSAFQFRAAQLEGVLQVTDAERFKQAVCQGIGSAKAFGFGLLSVARM